MAAGMNSAAQPSSLSRRGTPSAARPPLQRAKPSVPPAHRSSPGVGASASAISPWRMAVSTSPWIASASASRQRQKQRAALSGCSLEKAIAYSKSVYEVATGANAELSKVAERRVAEWNESFVNLLDKVSKNAPAGSDVAVAAVKSMIAAANSAYDNMTKVAKQATEIAEANVAAATETAKGLAKVKKSA